MSTSNYVTQEELAQMFGVTIHAVRKWRAKGKINYFRVGRTIRFTQADVQDFIDRHSYPQPQVEQVA